MSSSRSGRRGKAATFPAALPRGRTVQVRAADGIRLHTRVFGPPGGYPIVLSHGIVCAIRVWAYQIADLSRDYRVIAFDHRGHGRSGMPGRGGYTLAHLASDLDAVLEATLEPGERAVLAGHSMGGIAIAAWSDRYRHKVTQHADAVALINTTTGELLRHLNLLPVPRQLGLARVLAARSLIASLGSVPLPTVVHRPTRELVKMMAVGADADPRAGAFIHELFAATPPAGRGGCGKMLATALGAQHIDLSGLAVPTLVIGSEGDRLTPISQARRIAGAAPNLAGLIELSGGHCSMLERPAEVNQALRALASSVTGSGERRRASS
ncbi:MAG: alpha/beta fold hydrolase [Mycobacterium sp.]